MKLTTDSLRFPARRGLRALAGAAVIALVVAGASLATSSRIAVTPANNSLPTISGALLVGTTLSANAGTWSGSTPLAFQYQWLRCDSGGATCHPISGATAQTYQLQTGDLGDTARVQLIASNPDGSATATSDPTATIAQATLPSATALPAISGTAAVTSTSLDEQRDLERLRSADLRIRVAQLRHRRRKLSPARRCHGCELPGAGQ